MESVANSTTLEIMNSIFTSVHSVCKIVNFNLLLMKIMLLQKIFFSVVFFAERAFRKSPKPYKSWFLNRHVRNSGQGDKSYTVLLYLPVRWLKPKHHNLDILSPARQHICVLLTVLSTTNSTSSSTKCINTREMAVFHPGCLFSCHLNFIFFFPYSDLSMSSGQLLD